MFTVAALTMRMVLE